MWRGRARIVLLAALVQLGTGHVASWGEEHGVSSIRAEESRVEQVHCYP